MSSDDRLVAQARIALQTRPRRGLQRAVDAAPASRSNDPGLLYERARYARRLKKDVRVERTPLDVTRWESGGGGLVSTVADFTRYGQMLLNGGELDGVHVLSPATVQLMTRNSLPPDIRFAGFANSMVGPRAGSTWGLHLTRHFSLKMVPVAKSVVGASASWATVTLLNPM